MRTHVPKLRHNCQQFSHLIYFQRAKIATDFRLNPALLTFIYFGKLTNRQNIQQYPQWHIMVFVHIMADINIVTVIPELPPHNLKHPFYDRFLLSGIVIVCGVQIILLSVTVCKAKMIRQRGFYISLCNQNIFYEHISQIMAKPVQFVEILKSYPRVKMIGGRILEHLLVSIDQRKVPRFKQCPFCKINVCDIQLFFSFKKAICSSYDRKCFFLILSPPYHDPKMTKGPRRSLPDYGLHKFP